MKIIILFLLLYNTIFGIEIFLDKSATYDFNKIKSIENQFYEVEKNSLGITDGTLWLKLKLQNKLDKKVKQYILFNSHSLENIVLFYSKNGELVKKYNGILTPIDKRVYPYKDFIFDVTLEKNEHKNVFIKIETRHIKDFSTTVFVNKHDLYTTLLMKNSISILSFSLLIVFIVIISIIYKNTKDGLYLKYLLFLISTLCSQIFMSGFAQYLIDSIYYNNLMKIFVNFTAITVLYFIIEVFNLKEKSKILYRILNSLIFIFLALQVLELFNIELISILRVKVLIPLLLITIIFVVLYALVKKFQFSLFIFVGWSAFLFSSLMLNFNHLGFINTNYYIIIWQLGAVIEIISFSLMLLYRAKLVNDENFKQELLIEKQSKFVTIGETLSNIEHQWRSPLSRVSSILMEMQSYVRFKGTPSKEHIENSINEANKTLLYMTELVNDFKDFYIIDDAKKDFSIKNALDSTLNLLDHELSQNKIQIVLCIDNDDIIYGSQNDLVQVLLNIISNSKDLLIQRDIKDAKVYINLNKEKENFFITIEDNAKGIENSNINNIFDQFYSKKETSSSGIGLYIAKKIIEEKFKGKISVKNSNKGALFTIKLPLKLKTN